MSVIGVLGGNTVKNITISFGNREAGVYILLYYNLLILILGKLFIFYKFLLLYLQKGSN